MIKHSNSIHEAVRLQFMTQSVNSLQSRENCLKQRKSTYDKRFIRYHKCFLLKLRYGAHAKGFPIFQISHRIFDSRKFVCVNAFAKRTSTVDHSAADDGVAVVKNNGLTRGNGALRLVKNQTDRVIRGLFHGGRRRSGGVADLCLHAYG